MARKKKKPEPFVLDSSVALAWCFTDESSDYADRIAARFPDLDPQVPQLWHLEMANALLMGERRGRCTQSDITNWTKYLSSLPITVDDQTQVQAWGDTLNLARAQNLTAYDGSYLELALRRGLPIATEDARLRTAAAAVGVPIFMETDSGGA
jgi:predicted nucleic acid-binding protein